VTFAGIGPADFPVAFAVVMTVAAVLYVGFYVRWGHVLWDRPSPAFEEPFGWWLWGDALWRGYVRMVPFGGTVFAVMLTLLVPMIYGVGGVVGLIVTLALLLLTLAVGCLGMATIVLFNRPNRLVPHYLRDEPGAIAEWLDAWRRRRRPDPAGSR
jgi:hypothetical protein